MFDRQIVQRDVEIVGGLAGADGMCRPADFNVFVFVNGRLAGTLSPDAMVSRTDGSIGGGVRLGPDDTIAAEFSRFASDDPLCCPSRRVTVRIPHRSHGNAACRRSGQRAQHASTVVLARVLLRTRSWV